jgi:hypothetical protein
MCNMVKLLREKKKSTMHATSQFGVSNTQIRTNASKYGKVKKKGCNCNLHTHKC